MSKGIKRALVIAVVAVALIAVTTSVAFAWWESKTDNINVTANNVSNNYILAVTKDTAFTNSAKLVPNGAFTDDTHKTSICIGAFTPTVSSSSGANVTANANITYAITTFKVKNADQKATGNYVIIVTDNATTATGGVAVNTGVLTAGKKYYIYIAFGTSVDAATAKTFDKGAIELEIKLTATDKV